MKARLRNRKHAERRGRWSEYWAALLLMAKGYRILNLRYKTRSGEIDLLVVSKANRFQANRLLKSDLVNEGGVQVSNDLAGTLEPLVADWL